MIYDGISRNTILDLAKTTGEPAISIYVPTYRTGPEAMQGRIKLKNLLALAENRLVEQGMRRTLATELLSEATALIEDSDFWNDRLDAVAIFVSPGFFKAHHLPYSTPELLHIGPHFYVRPLVRALNYSAAFYVLALDKNHVRLMHCTPRAVNEMKVGDMPHSLEKFVAVEHVEKQYQYHTAGRIGGAGSVIGHGAADKGEDEKDRLHRFSQAISRSLEKFLGASREPVVLVGTKDFQDIFRSVAHLPCLLPEGVAQSPKMLDGRQLCAAASPLVEAFEDTARQAAMERYREIAGTGLTAQTLDQVLPAAAEGKVDALFILPNAAVWGQGDIELINEATIATLENSGTVYEIADDELSLPEPIAASFRY